MNRNMLPVGTLLRNGTYKVTQHLANGGFGNTYVVENLVFNETYALKEFFIKGVNTRSGNSVLVSQIDNKTLFETQKEKFKKEAIRLRKLNHPGIVKLYDLFEENGTFYYVMDFIDGRSLAEVLKQQGPMPEAEARKMLEQLLHILDAVHSQGLTHMDIKPSNIMVDKGGAYHLIDFGASKQMTGSERQATAATTAFAYTKGFAPIEQVNEEMKNVGPWTDLYALGATLYMMLTQNEPPSSSEIIEQGEKAFLFPSSTSSDTKEIILWMMQPSRQKRPQSVQDVLSPLSSENQGLATEVKGSRDTIVHIQKEPSRKGQSSKGMRYALGGACILLLASLTLFLSFRSCHSNKPSLYEDDEDEPTEGMVKVKGHDNAGNHETANDADVLSFQVGEATFRVKRVKGDTFMMGATSEQAPFAEEHEYPVHNVTLKDYYIGETEVTQDLWEKVMGYNPSAHQGGNLPVESVSYEECQQFIRELNRITHKRFRLPTEAEWEFAARGGNASRGYVYAGSNDAEEVGWTSANSTSTHPVRQKRPNELGLYDMTGNVCEWCQDWFGSYSDSWQENPQGPAQGTVRVGRGGGWCNSAKRNRVSIRNSGNPTYSDHNLGFRLAM